MLADLLHDQALDKKSDLLAPSYAPYRTLPPFAFVLCQINLFLGLII